jgi:hypothetical protein
MHGWVLSKQNTSHPAPRSDADIVVFGMPWMLRVEWEYRYIHFARVAAWARVEDEGRS